jgi:hypothetical protein
MMHDPDRLARMRADGFCTEVGPAVWPDSRPHVCTLKAGHPGAHVATVGVGLVVDTWGGLK